jgi:cobalt-precorrin 5A hydrolase
VLCAGIGCNRGTAKEEILELIHRTFREHGLSVLALRALASIELKSDEPGLLAAAEAFGVDILWFPAEELKSTEVPHPSTMVAGHVGTPSVCEAAALKAAGGGRLIVAKQKSRNATLAIAAAPTAPGY